MATNKKIKITCQAATVLQPDELEDFQGGLKTISETDLRRLKNQIRRHGISAPIFVWQHKGKNYVLDGHQRLKALRGLALEGYQFDGIPAATISAATVTEAREKLLAFSSTYGQIDVSELDAFVKGLGELEDLRLVAGSEIDLDIFTPGEDDAWQDAGDDALESALSFSKMAQTESSNISVTLVFPKEHKDAIQRYLRAFGKGPLSDQVLGEVYSALGESV